MTDSSEHDVRVDSTNSAPTMQDALLALQRYWTERGCLVTQPFNTEVGAGTANPATMLRVLGPEPWRVGYVEPSVRPDDSRYGENPNRLQTHTQFQVILKPDPGNPQELYLGSLEALGVDIRAHDIRFVEDNWASPALGSWGLGWEVWLDGLEITQFTYFQQAGGLVLDPVSVEITYGLERILMALQGVAHFKDIAYADGISYGEIFGQAEYEMSRYYLDDADVEATKRMFDEYAAEAGRLLDARLPVPAYVQVLKCSHAFNVLDARGAISTTERAKAFGQMRTLTRRAAQLWAERRQELEHPLGVVAPLASASVPAPLPEVDAPATLLFEIGVEEMPHSDVTATATWVREVLAGKLAATRLGHGEISGYATPRRIIALVRDVQPAEPDAERTVRGPRVTAAYDADGNPTKAAQGFARGQGVDPADLVRVDVDGVEHVAVVRTDVGRGAMTVLSDVLAQVVTELRAEKNMRWRDPGLSFSRPVRYLLAMLGEAELPVAVSSLRSGTTTRVHRTAADPEVRVPSAEGYLEFLAGHGIVADAGQRRERIVADAAELAATVGGTVDTTAEAALVDEVTNLVEEPNTILGSFDERYLDLPEQILTTVMRKHQRYLPVRGADGLLPHFVAVANGDCDRDLVRAGNEAVLRARYEDAAFFWRADLKIAPEQHRLGLVKLTFEERLGSVADRADRIAAVAGTLAELAGLSTEDRTTVERAGALAKFDLASHMVVELSSLAGTMAREYAARAGETPEVARALAEMEQPRSASDTPPESTAGAVLALADRFDLLAGLFAIGATPTGSSDPFGLRRAAGGVVTILRATPAAAAITLTEGLAAAAARITAHGVELEEDALADAREFTIRRYEQQLLDAGHEHNLVQAVLPLADAPATADTTLAELEKRVGDEDFAALTAVLQRARRIVPVGTPAQYDAGDLVEPAELALHEVVTAVAARLAGRPRDLADFTTLAAPLVTPVNDFFDGVMVMAEDERLRAARLGLLATITALAEGVVDWKAL
ncbi:Glycyl-tRNA synthetase alpha chain [Actinokineospora spheciospongiae]|uniref:Multifunctional fusion protein n=1 Tax=Actinokineospora spheciospongiae TaxID=909613 RepID=W7J6F2_9PSEU|nr:glycine--tRNA ligase [Actinokineospora spheciospongiae]EWC64581.1 Glycyl-tRNA synthetase alpha chain [Actinokineospora spheciospongiae]